ncbi:MAG: hypothetical protein ACI4OR_03165 [Alphaproteobacteria bacterium]
MAILDDFKQWLKGQGYSECTPSGKPSTVFDYPKRIEKVSQNEGMSVNDLSRNIDNVLSQYGPSGSKAGLGQASHSAVLNALRRFKEFLDDQKH